MEQLHVSSAVIAAILFAMAMGIVLPVALFLVMKFKYKCKAVPFLAGALTMFVAACILEQILHTLVLTSPVGATIQGNIWLYALYGAFCAALFEEAGRFYTMHSVLRKYHGENSTALMYGAGHAGFECAYLLIFGMVNNLFAAIMINSGSVDQLTTGLSGDLLEQTLSSIYSLASIAPSLFVISVFERIFAMALQIVMSVFMWQAAAKGRKIFFAAAFGIHFVMDFAAVILNNYFGSVAAEAALVVGTAILGYLAYKLYKKEEIA